ncbi:MAG: RNA polymerase sigma factor [Nitrosomonadales bacterium]|nr:RNA polymerase sigma factor [Nitrosomonadales bacterium]
MGHDRENEQRLQRFLAGVEGRAFRIAQFATRNRDDALELVQEAMMKLVQNYAGRGDDELNALFHSILQSRLRDWQRRQSVRNRFRSWFTWDEDSDEGDALEQSPANSDCEPAFRLENDQFMHRLNHELGELPYRQQQVFLLRVWEGLDIAQTAAAMQCSESSVKTHHARALHKLQEQLEEYR